MSVKAKFKVCRFEAAMMQRQNPETKVYENVEVRTVVLAPVYSAEEGGENKKFWDYTPSGEIKLGTVNPEAWRQFDLDGEYYVTFERAEQAATAKVG